MRIPLQRSRPHILRINPRTDAHGWCRPGPLPDRSHRKLPAVTSGLYGAYSRRYVSEWKLGRILPMRWHADAGADNMLLRTPAAATYFPAGALTQALQGGISVP
jgi:hypothetical protein